MEIADSDFDDRPNESYQLGIVSGLEQAAGYLLKRAQIAFTNDKDGIARMLREYSQELARMGAEAYPGKN